MNSTRRIWRTTTKQALMEEQLKILEHRLTSMSLSPTNNLFDGIIDDIDKKITQSFNTLKKEVSNTCAAIEFQKLSQLKQDILSQSIEISLKLKEPYAQMIKEEQQKFYLKKNADQQTT